MLFRISPCLLQNWGKKAEKGKVQLLCNTTVKTDVLSVSPARHLVVAVTCVTVHQPSDGNLAQLLLTRQELPPTVSVHLSVEKILMTDGIPGLLIRASPDTVLFHIWGPFQKTGFCRSWSEGNSFFSSTCAVNNNRKCVFALKCFNFTTFQPEFHPCKKINNLTQVTEITVEISFNILI